jgi:hypothetical protein
VGLVKVMRPPHIDDKGYKAVPLVAGPLVLRALNQREWFLSLWPHRFGRRRFCLSFAMRCHLGICNPVPDGGTTGHSGF